MMDLKQAIDYLQPIADSTPLAGYGAALAVAMDAMRAQEAQMDKESAQAIYRAALDTFGTEAQTKKLFEEIGEFMEAFCKCSAGRDKLSHLAEEMADVHNMLDQMAVLFDCEAEVERQKRYKLKRLEQRIEAAARGGQQQ